MQESTNENKIEIQHSGISEKMAILFIFKLPFFFPGLKRIRHYRKTSDRQEYPRKKKYEKDRDIRKGEREREQGVEKLVVFLQSHLIFA